MKSQINMHMTGGCLVVSIDADFDDRLIHDVQKMVLDSIYEKSVRGLIIDLSAVWIMDSCNIKMFHDMTRMAKLLGATTMLVGLKPGVVAALIDLDVDVSELRTAVTLDGALHTLKPIVAPKMIEACDENEDEEEIKDMDQEPEARVVRSELLDDIFEDDEESEMSLEKKIFYAQK